MAYVIDRTNVRVGFTQMKTAIGIKPMTNTIHMSTDDDRYLCNQAVATFDEKKTKDWSKVTCFNCKKHLYEKTPQPIREKIQFQRKKSKPKKIVKVEKGYVFLGGMKLSRKKWGILMRGRR